MSDQKLLQQFVDSFARRDDMMLIGDACDELAVEQGTEDWDNGNAIPTWRPIRVNTPPEALELIFNAIGGGPLPRLYQDLVLSYRWLEIDLGILLLCANPPGPGLTGLVDSILSDRCLAETLLPSRYVPFARQGAGLYDPLCFDLHQMNNQSDCPIVQFDHEAILCESRIVERARPWASFRDLVTEVVFSGENE